MKLSDPNIRIITVHPSNTIRQLINQDLRARGYQDVLGVQDLSEALTLMASESIHWIITTPALKSDVNVFQILKLVTEDRTFIDLRVSLILDERMDPFLLSKAFDLGLLSYHERMATKLDIEIEMKVLFERFEKAGGALDLVSADYLRNLLTIEQRFTDLLRFENALFPLHQGNLDLSFRLAEAQLRAGEKATAVRILSQIALIDPDKNQEIAHLWEKFEKGTFAPLNEAGLGRPDMIGVKHAIIIDPDQAQLSLMRKLLLELGIPKVDSFTDSEKALHSLESGSKPEIILFEWKSQPLSGPIFAQRARELIGFALPLTAVSQELEDEDFTILKEMGVTNRIRKPIESSRFFKEFLWLVHQNRVPTEPFIILQKIKQAMADQDYEEIAKLTKKFMENERCSPADKSILQAELSYFRGHYSSSRDQALNTLKSGMINVDVLNTLGKSLMKMRDFETALRCFETAEMVSPNNVRRICNIAESRLELGQMKAYQRKLDQAKDLDPDATVVQELELKGALVQKNGTKAQALMQSLKSLLTILSFTNNRAIAQIRTSHFEEGIDLYREALAAVPPEQIEIKGILQYNLGLALARLNRLDEASHVITHSEIDKVPKVSAKGKSLLTRLQKAIANGERFVANQESAPVAQLVIPSEDAGQTAYEETLMALTIGPGDLCLHRIWQEAKADNAYRSLTADALNIRKKVFTNRSA